MVRKLLPPAGIITALLILSCSSPPPARIPDVRPAADRVSESADTLEHVEAELQREVESGSAAAPTLTEWRRILAQAAIVGIESIALRAVSESLMKTQAELEQLGRERDRLAGEIEQRDAHIARLRSQLNDAEAQRDRAVWQWMIVAGAGVFAAGIAAAVLWNFKYGVSIIIIGAGLIFAGRFFDKYAWIIDLAIAGFVACAIIGLIVLAWMNRHALRQVAREVDKFVLPKLDEDAREHALDQMRSHQTLVTKALVDSSKREARAGPP